VKRHPFFKSIDWAKLYRREMKPPFIPTTTDGKTSTDNIDEEFTKETPRDTPVMSSFKDKMTVNFQDFTYTAPESRLDGSGQNQDD